MISETQEFYRIGKLPPYVFAEVNRLKAAARARGADIIDLGMGNPDMPTPQHIVDKLVETVAKPRTNRYSASKGIPGLRKARVRCRQIFGAVLREARWRGCWPKCQFLLPRPRSRAFLAGRSPRTQRVPAARRP